MSNGIESLGFSFGEKSDVGIARRGKNNEDATLAFSAGDKLPRNSEIKGIFAVADGMGGGNAGDVASREALRMLSKLFSGREYIDWGNKRGLYDGNFLNILKEYVGEINTTINDMAHRQGKHPMGTTLDVLVMKDGRYYIAHVGDSRIYRIKNGVIEQLTSDHSAVAELVRRGMTQEQAEKTIGSNVVTNIIGDKCLVNIDVLSGDLKLGDYFIICTDGLRSVGTEDIKHAITRYRTCQEVCDALVNLANQRDGSDNVSVIVVNTVIAGQEIFPSHIHPRQAVSEYHVSKFSNIPIIIGGVSVALITTIVVGGLYLYNPHKTNREDNGGVKGGSPASANTTNIVAQKVSEVATPLENIEKALENIEKALEKGNYGEAKGCIRNIKNKESKDVVFDEKRFNFLKNITGLFEKVEILPKYSHAETIPTETTPYYIKIPMIGKYQKFLELNEDEKLGSITKGVFKNLVGKDVDITTEDGRREVIDKIKANLDDLVGEGGKYRLEVNDFGKGKDYKDRYLGYCNRVWMKIALWYGDRYEVLIKDRIEYLQKVLQRIKKEEHYSYNEIESLQMKLTQLQQDKKRTEEENEAQKRLEKKMDEFANLIQQELSPGNYSDIMSRYNEINNDDKVTKNEYLAEKWGRIKGQMVNRVQQLISEGNNAVNSLKSLSQNSPRKFVKLKEDLGRNLNTASQFYGKAEKLSSIIDKNLQVDELKRSKKTVKQESDILKELSYFDTMDTSNQEIIDWEKPLAKRDLDYNKIVSSNVGSAYLSLVEKLINERIEYYKNEITRLLEKGNFIDAVRIYETKMGYGIEQLPTWFRGRFTSEGEGIKGIIENKFLDAHFLVKKIRSGQGGYDWTSVWETLSVSKVKKKNLPNLLSELQKKWKEQISAHNKGAWDGLIIISLIEKDDVALEIARKLWKSKEKFPIKSVKKDKDEFWEIEIGFYGEKNSKDKEEKLRNVMDTIEKNRDEYDIKYNYIISKR